MKCRACERQQCRIWPNFNDEFRTQRAKSLQPITETDRLTHMASPIICSRNLINLGQPPGQVRDKAKARSGKADCVGLLLKLVENRVNQRRMKSMRHREPLATNTLRDKVLAEPLDLFRTARDHSLGWTIDGGN